MTIHYTYFFDSHLFASKIRYPRCPNIMALFVNMVFIDEDIIIIKNLYQLKGYNARQFKTKFLDKGWTTSSISILLKKFRDTWREPPNSTTELALSRATHILQK